MVSEVLGTCGYYHSLDGHGNRANLLSLCSSLWVREYEPKRCRNFLLTSIYDWAVSITVFCSWSRKYFHRRLPHSGTTLLLHAKTHHVVLLMLRWIIIIRGNPLEEYLWLILFVFSCGRVRKGRSCVMAQALDSTPSQLECSHPFPVRKLLLMARIFHSIRLW